jgi:hypothetical protein
VVSERISACLIVQDEQERIAAALQSVAFCDETIVVDGGSSDATAEIARAAGARVIENPWPGFAVQRNLALDAATGDWVLEIDADERVSPSLRASIQALLSQPPPGAAMAVCALRNRFLGGMLGPSAKYPAYRARIFRREAYRHDETRAVHEGIEPHERPVVLDGDLEHELASSLSEALTDTWRYARLESLHVPRPSSLRAALTGIFLRPTAKLVYRTVVDGGWRDGWRGMLKISLDAGTDALVWVLSIRRGRRSQATKSQAQMQTSEGASRDGHFGRRPVGPPKVVALSGDRAASRAAGRWLAGLREQGIDVALVCPAANGGNERIDAANTGAAATGSEQLDDAVQLDDARSDVDVPLQPVSHLRPLSAIRALEIETQLRTIDAVVTVGARARLVGRFLPRTLRPQIPGLDADIGPTQAAELVRASIGRN